MLHIYLNIGHRLLHFISLWFHKMLALFKIKAFANEQFNGAKMMTVFDGEMTLYYGTIGENAGYQHFLLFP